MILRIQLKKQIASLKFAPQISCLGETCLVIVCSKLVLGSDNDNDKSKRAQFNACMRLSTLLIPPFAPANLLELLHASLCLDKHNQPYIVECVRIRFLAASNDSREHIWHSITGASCSQLKRGTGVAMAPVLRQYFSLIFLLRFLLPAATSAVQNTYTPNTSG